VDKQHVQAIEAYEAEYRQKQVEIGGWAYQSLKDLREEIGPDDFAIWMNPYRTKHSTPLIDS
jgi:hypothetical protein